MADLCVKRGREESDADAAASAFLEDECDDFDREQGLQLLSLVSALDFGGVSSLLQTNTVDASFQDETTGTSALMVAAGTGSLQMVQLLLGQGAPWNALDRQGRCAGDYAVDSGVQVRDTRLSFDC